MILEFDFESKVKQKEYWDKRQKAKESEIKEGDKVFVKQDKKNKLSTTYGEMPYRVIEKKGNSVQIENDEGVQKRRNVKDLKKIVFEKGYEKVNESDVNSEVISERPTRKRIPPQ